MALNLKDMLDGLLKNISTSTDEIYNFSKTKLEDMLDGFLKNISTSIDEIYIFSKTKLITMVNKQLEKYRDELDDENSNYYKLFHVILTVNDLYAYNIIYLFFTGIDRDIFKLDDYFVFVENKESKIDYSSVLEYVLDLNVIKYKIMKNRFFTGVYSKFGNFKRYLDGLKSLNVSSAPNNSLNNIFFKEKISDDVFIEINNWILKPVIDYINLDNVYRNKIEAEQDYWANIREYLGTPSRKLSNSKNFQLLKLADLISNSSYEDNINAIPVFLQRKLSKSLFFNNYKLDNLLINLLKNSYNKFSYSEVDSLIEKMIWEMVEYYDRKDIQYFDYNLEAIQVPDIKKFIDDKVSSFIDFANANITEGQISTKNFEIDDYKELNFYHKVIIPFIQLEENDENFSSYSKIESLRNELSDDYLEARNNIILLLEYLKAHGKYY